MRKSRIWMAGLGLLFVLMVCVLIFGDHLFPERIGFLIINDGADEDISSNSDAGTVEVKTADTLDAANTVNDIATSDTTPAASVTTMTEEASPAESFTKDNATQTISQEDSQMFYYEAISQEIKDRINGVSYADNCDVPYEELRYVSVLHWGFDGETHTGELIVNKAIAEDIVSIFQELYDAKYPIERMILIDEYKADDNASMADNNTSAFNYRTIDDGSGRLSKHSYGLAIDINPLYNPYVRKVDGETVVSPENGAEYADRTLDCDYYISEGDVCYEAFVSRGFTWGGNWKNQKDYQHFQKILN